MVASPMSQKYNQGAHNSFIVQDSSIQDEEVLKLENYKDFQQQQVARLKIETRLRQL